LSFFSKIHERVLRKFTLYRVEFVLIGGHAVVFHGVRRTTSDIDLLVRPTIKNGERIIAAFKDLKLLTVDITPEDFEQEHVFTFGMEPDAVDIITFSRGVSMDRIFDNAITKSIDDLKIRIIDIRDLLKNKESLKRQGERKLIDEQDILALKRILRSK
jgi:predicted nucleotidyltransferase